MKKFLILSFIFFLFSCSPTYFMSPKTINIPLYSKSKNSRELIRLKYGEPSKIEKKEKQEIWKYNYISLKKSNRTVTFDSNGKVIQNKKHYKIYHMKTGLNKYAYIAYGFATAVLLIVGPFPALL